MRSSLVVAFSFSILISHAQLLLSEDFNTSAGNTINNLGWFTDCGSPDILVSSGGLTYPGYIGSGVGNAAQLLNFGFSNGGAHTKNFGGSGTPIYVGFMINVTNASGGTPGGGGCTSGTPGIIAFDTGGGGSENDNAVIVQNEIGGYRVGLMSDCCGSNMYGTTLAYGITYLMILKQTGSQISLFVNPVLGQPEPGGFGDVQIGISGGGSPNGISISSRAGADLLIDGLRVSNDWNAITAVPPTVQTTNIIFSNIQANGLQVDYSSGNGTGRIVLAKEGSPVDAVPVSGTFYSSNNTFGFGQEIGTGNYVVLDQCCAGPHSIFNLDPATTYYFKAFEYHSPSGIILYNTDAASGNPASISTLFSEPGTQAASITSSSVTSNSMILNWANGNGTGHLVFGKQNFLSGALPIDGSNYTANTIFGNGSDLGNSTFVIYSGAGTSTLVGNLSPGTPYEFMVTGYNGTGSQTNYLTNNNTNNPRVLYTLSLEPSAHSGLFSALNSGTNQINLSFSAANTIPNASGYIILRRQDLTNPTASGVNDGTAPGSLPLTGGTSLVTIITNTAQVSYNDSGLSPAMNYNYAIIPYGFNGTNNQTYNYRTAATIPTSASFTLASEPSAQPTAINFTNPTSTGFTVGYTAASGSPTGYIAVRKLGSSPSGGVPLDGTAYALNAPIGDGNVAFVGSALSFGETGLAASSVYHYDIYSYNGSGPQINYRIISPLEGSRTTLATEPSSQPTVLNFSAVTTTSFNASFTAAAGSPAGYLVIRRQGSSPTGTPADGTAYSVGNAIGDGTVAAIGASTSFSESSLSPGTTYFYDIFSFNGSGLSLNYRVTSPLENSRITLSSAPTANSGSSINTTSFTANWTSVTGALNYKLDVSADNFTSYVAGFQDLTVASTSQNVTGLSAGTTYQYRVRANNASGASANSNTISLPTLCVAPVANAVTGISSSGFDVSWNAVAGATSYALDVSSTNFSTFVTGYNGLVVAGTVANVTGLSSSTAYSYRVRAVNASGPSANSNTVNATTLAPGPVASAATSITQTSFTANWSAVGGATDYSLDVGDVGFANLVSGYSNLSVAGTSQSVTGLSPGVTYEYRVRANNVSGSSANSNVISLITIPANPVATNATNITSNGFIANWSSLPGATSYLLEVSNDNFSTTLPGYSPKEISTPSDIVSGLQPGSLYAYRVRSKNSSGSSGLSNIIEQITLPTIPELKPFNQSLANAGGFVAEWTPVAGADGYEIDVTTQSSNFATFVSGYNAKVINGGTTADEVVTGLVSGQFYRYRIRAFNAGGVTGNSDPKLAVTTGGSYTPPAVSPGASSQSSVEASVSGGAGILTLTFFHRKISESDFIAEPETTVSTGNTAVPILNSYFDEIGMEYYFEVKDELENSSSTNPNFVYLTKNSESIPNLSFGGKRENYRIFSIPLQLSDNTIDNIFNPVIILYGGYKKDKWRLVQYLNGQNVDYTEGLSRIDQGKGYWFNAVDPITLNISGTTIQANQSQPFVLNLSAGWNQIGNPFNFPISWSDVLAYNNNPTTVSGLFTYNPGSISFDQNTPLLEAWEGGFVRADQAINLEIPVTVKRTAGRIGRRNEIEGRDISQESWLLPITLKQGIAVNDLAAIGMHPEAVAGKDKFDEHTLPRFVNFLEFNSFHEDYFMPKFTNDIVNTSATQTWDISIESNFEGPEIELNWDNLSMGQNSAQLWLVDVSESVIVDMKLNDSYKYPASERHELKIVFGENDDSFLPPLNTLGRAYPNPFTESVSIPLISNGSEQLTLSVYDLMGRRVKNLVMGQLKPGYHEIVWDGTSEQGLKVSQGVYIYKLSSVSQSIQLGRLVLR